MERIKLVNEDCVDYLRTLEKNSIDCVITDPPYFIDKLDNHWDAEKVLNDKPNSHVKHLPKGMKFSKNQTVEFHKFYTDVSKIIFEKMKPGGFFLSFSSPRLYHAMAMGMDEAGFEIRDMINWVYTQSMPKGMSVMNQIERLKLSSDEKEVIKEYCKDRKTPQIKSCFEPICVAMKPLEGTFMENYRKYGVGLVNFGAKVGEEKVPANIITTEPIDVVYDSNFLVKKPSKKEKGEYNNHLSVKPVPLMVQLIEMYTRENAVVVDPFMGSGTTMVACKETKRNGIGIEKSKEYYDIAVRRVSEYSET